MAPPLVLFNSYVEANDKSLIDLVSKFFIISELPFAIIRLPLLFKINLHFKNFTVFYSLAVACFYVIIFYNVKQKFCLNIVISIFIFQCILFMLISVFKFKELKCYYNTLNDFDKKVGGRPNCVNKMLKGLIPIVVTLLYAAILFVLPHFTGIFLPLHPGLAPFILCNILEVHYCGHLVSLLTPRLRLVNYFMKLSISNCTVTNLPNVEEFGFLKGCNSKTLCEMEKVMCLYHTIIRAYKYLLDAIKWQLLVSIVTTFIIILVAVYEVSLFIIKNNAHLTVLVTYLGVTGSLIIPLFSPCVFGDQVKKEVRRLRELLALRLHENKLDKPSRGTARALIAWTDERYMSFSLLRMLDIDISLPFKFVGLLVTYLIISLQFQKVINP